jgi:asparagine N-glycosylation enzyme membrane subunit Stt3
MAGKIVENTKGKNGFLQYFLLVVFMFLLVHVVVYTKAIIETPNAQLVDTDPYMRLVRVEQLAETGDWYDSVIHRSNYPYGDELHWTRPLDVILVAGAYLLSPIQGFQKGLLTWGIMIGPLVGIFCLLALFWATRKILNRNAQRLLWLLFIAQTLLFQIFTFGRPDHHSLLMLLFILLLGCLFRIIDQPHNNKYILISGFIAALSLWVSVETIFAIIMVFVTMTFFWLIRGAAYSRQLLLFSLTIFAFSTAFLFIERPLSALFKVNTIKFLLSIFLF